MVKIKRTLSLICLLLTLTGIKAADRTLVVETTTSGRLSIRLSDNPEITFSGQTMLISSAAGNYSLEISDIVQYAFESVATGLGQVPSDELRFCYSANGQITIEGAESPSDVRLYAVDGRELPIQVSANGDRITVSLSTLPKGVYIISANNKQNLKIYKR